MESESDPLTRQPVDLFEKEPLKGNSEVHLHTPTKFGEDRSKDLGGDREQTDRQTDRQTLLDLKYDILVNAEKDLGKIFSSFCAGVEKTVIGKSIIIHILIW